VWRRRESNHRAIPRKCLMCCGLCNLDEIRHFLPTRTIRSNAWVEARNFNVEQAFKRFRRFERFGRDVVCHRNSSNRQRQARAIEGVVTPEKLRKAYDGTWQHPGSLRRDPGLIPSRLPLPRIIHTKTLALQPVGYGDEQWLQEEFGLCVPDLRGVFTAKYRLVDVDRERRWAVRG
jgi:hypothetical protein